MKKLFGGQVYYGTVNPALTNFMTRVFFSSFFAGKRIFRLLTHMSGKIQTKQEYIDEIMDGTLNYYESIIDNPKITIQGGVQKLFLKRM